MATQIAQLAQQTIVTGSSTQVLSATPIISYSALFRASSSNIGVIVVGNSGVTVNNTAIALSANETFLMENIGYLGGHEKIDLRTIFIGGTFADKLMISYTVRV